MSTTLNKGQIIQELRQLFKEGATPSRLIRHILASHPEETVSRWMLRDYLEEAFGLTLARGVKSSEDYEHPDLRCAVLNRTLIPEIIQQRKQWDSPPESQMVIEPCWLDGLEVTNPEIAKKAATALPHPGLSEATWANLSPAEQESLHVQMASHRLLLERVLMLATLAERLQHQVEKLEQQIGPSQLSLVNHPTSDLKARP